MILSATVIFEVLLLAAVYYGFIRHLQKSRGGGLLAGFIVVLVLGVLAFGALLRTFKLPHLEWIADAALPALSIALLIIFQPELRLAISRIGNLGMPKAMRRFFGGGGEPAQTERVTEALVGACERMARQRIGALIALQRTQGIEGFAQGGSRIDAEVTTRLLESLFYPGTPLHDGAAFVIDGRLRYAGCKIPVSSTNPEVRNLRLGTRHAAALGLSEESDALVVVVSEERGRISIARHGHLEMDLDPADLRREILRTFSSSSEEPSISQPDLETSLEETRKLALPPELADETREDVAEEATRP